MYSLKSLDEDSCCEANFRISSQVGKHFTKRAIKTVIWSQKALEVNHEVIESYSGVLHNQKWINITEVFRDVMDHNSKSANKENTAIF